MAEFRTGPTVDARVVRLAEDYFSSTEDARDALRRLISEIPEDQLIDVRGIQILLMK